MDIKSLIESNRNPEDVLDEMFGKKSKDKKDKIDKSKPGTVWKTWTGKYRAVSPKGWKASFKEERNAKEFAKTGRDNEGGAHDTDLEDVRDDKHKK